MAKVTSASALQKFVDAQHPVYAQVLQELRQGTKTGHWMWFVFPQLLGLGRSETAAYYALAGLDEASAYLHHPVLGRRLLECVRILLALTGKSARDIFGYPDELKLKSSMTLFALATEETDLFRQVLDRYYAGEMDELTLSLLSQQG